MSETITVQGTSLYSVMAELADHLQDAPGFVLSGVRTGQPASWTVTAHAVAIPTQRAAVVKLCSVCGLTGGSHRLFCSDAVR